MAARRRNYRTDYRHRITGLASRRQRGDSSTMALTPADSEPTVPASPAPFTPSGLVGVGAGLSSITTAQKRASGRRLAPPHRTGARRGVPLLGRFLRSGHWLSHTEAPVRWQGGRRRAWTRRALSVLGIRHIDTPCTRSHSDFVPPSIL